ncbi:preprotein translocase subunit SecY [Candidatus Bathyarchaeota archaeon]|nr:preprotein translocase subunit SecY [Candidatus Bathyarchaeota archaeon]
MAGRFLSLFKPIARIIPEIKDPERRVRFNEKIFWTALVLIIYLIMSEVRLYGVPTTIEERLSALRVIFASNRGTLMELGIGPIVTAGLILQLLIGSAMVQADMSNPEDRSLFTTASKVFAIILTGVQAIAYIVGGMYNTAETTLPGTAAIIIFLQLLASGLIVMLLDELVQKGWGFGSGISLFIMAGVAQQIFWQCFSPGTGLFVGALSVMLGGNEPLTWWIFGGGSYPSLVGFVVTIITFLIIIYVEGVRVELRLSYAGYKGFRSRYPIKLLYVSNLPVIFASALFANVYLFSQLFWNNFNQNNSNFWLNLLGQYEWIESSGGGDQTLQPIGGLVYYVTAPHSLSDVAARPDRAFGYLAILIVFCIIFSLTWLEVGGLGPSTIGKQLVDAGMQIPGYRRSGRAMESILKRYIPTVTVLGGIIVALIAGVSDFFGVFGSGMGILLSVGILYQYYELLMRERASEMYPAFRRLFGE